MRRTHLTLFTLSLVVLAQIASASDAVSLLAQDIKAQVKTLSTSIEVYHWRIRSRIWTEARAYFPPSGELPFHSDDALHYVAERSRSFFEADLQDAGVLGNAFYASRDPFSSSRQGDDWETGNGWILLGVSLPSGFHYLDLRSTKKNDNIIFVSPATRAALRSEFSCALRPQASQRIREHFLGSKACEAPFKMAMRKARVEGILYLRSTYALAGCHPSADAWALLDAQSLTSDRISLLTRESSSPDALRFGRFLNRMARENESIYDFPEGSVAFLLKWGRGRSISSETRDDDRGFREWKRQQWGCLVKR